jgi:hypothetical protein
MAARFVSVKQAFDLPVGGEITLPGPWACFIFQICKYPRRAIESLKMISKTLNLLIILNFIS